MQILVNKGATSENLKTLFQQADWAGKRTIQSIETMLQQTSLYLVAKQDDKLIGFARAITDGVYRAYIEDVIVSFDHQKLGVGKRVVESLLRELAECEEILLNCTAENVGFYEKLGFEKSTIVGMTKQQ